jgi:hypothetical protein
MFARGPPVFQLGSKARRTIAVVRAHPTASGRLVELVMWSVSVGMTDGDVMDLPDGQLVRLLSSRDGS